MGWHGVEARAVLLQVMLEIFANATINDDEGSDKHKATKLVDYVQHKQAREEEERGGHNAPLLWACLLAVYWHTRLIYQKTSRYPQPQNRLKIG
jgi:hypothetical protein